MSPTRSQVEQAERRYRFLVAGLATVLRRVLQDATLLPSIAARVVPER